jgi:hypothetical protein
LNDCAEDDFVTPPYTEQFRAPIKRQDEREIQATKAKYDTATPRSAAKDRDLLQSADLLVHLGRSVTASPKYHHRSGTFPETKGFQFPDAVSISFFQPLKELFVKRQIPLRCRQG